MRTRVMVGLILLVVIVGVAIFSLPDGKLHVIFCDVGQGDATLIVKGNWQMLVDAGPDEAVLECLQDHLPFYDHTLEVGVLTHPQADHEGGWASVLKSYALNYFVSNPVNNTTQMDRGLKKLIKEKGIKLVEAYTGTELKMGELVVRPVWPSKDFFDQHTLTAPASGDQVLGLVSDGQDMNNLGIATMVSWREFDLLLAADVDKGVEQEVMGTGELRQVEVVKVPHHGSRTGMSEEWFGVVSPKLAVISVGKKNRYGHPDPETLDLINKHHVPIKRTDMDGEVEVVTDGTNWQVKE